MKNLITRNYGGLLEPLKSYEIMCNYRGLDSDANKITQFSILS